MHMWAMDQPVRREQTAVLVQLGELEAVVLGKRRCMQLSLISVYLQTSRLNA